MKKDLRIELGCGLKKKKGFIGFDSIDFSDKYPKGEFIVADLEKGIPLPDNSVSELYSAHFFEHHRDLMSLIQEVRRVCKNRAKLEIIVPHFTMDIHPFHYSRWGWHAWDAFTVGHRDPDYGDWFKMIKKELVFKTYWPFRFLKFIPQIYEKTFLRSFIFCDEIRYVLEVVK